MLPVSETPDRRQSYVLRPRPPVRALAIASLAALAGAVLTVLAAAFDLPGAVLLLGAVVLGVALALAVAGLLLTARLRSTISLDPAGLRLSRGHQRVDLAWGDISAVDLTADSIVLRTRDHVRTELPNPRGTSDPVVSSMLNAIREALDADRGYESFPRDRS